MFSVDEINDLAIGQLSPIERDRALEAFNGFAALFNKDWVTGYFQGARSPRFVRAIVAMWDDWEVILNLPKADKLIERWQAGINEGGVQPEVRVFARLVRAGAAVELFPEVSDHIPDCRFRPMSDDGWAYLEVSQRGLSKVRQHAQGVLSRVSEAGANAVAGMHGKVAILRMPADDEVERIVTWLAAGPRSGEKLEDLAEFYLDALDRAVGPNDVIQERVPRPRLLSTHVALPGPTLRGTACLSISDEGAQELLKAEAAQLPFDQPGVVVLDVSSVIGGYQEWVPLIQRRLQPTINTRISAVVLLTTALTQEGLTIEGQVLINPNSGNHITEEGSALLQKVVEA